MARIDRMRPSRWAALMLAVLAGVLGVAACGSAGAPAGTGTSAGSGGTVVRSGAGSAGAYLTDGAGRTVYLWEGGSKSRSACSGGCAAAWPPVITHAAPTAQGAARMADLGTLTRADSTVQVTYAGHPLYYYSGDTAPGQTNGQGSNGFGSKWWLVTPAGTALTGSIPAQTSGVSPGTTSTGTSKYGY